MKRLLLTLLLVGCGGDDGTTIVDPHKLVTCEGQWQGPQCAQACAQDPEEPEGPGCTATDGNGCAVTIMYEGVRGCCYRTGQDPVWRFHECPH